MLCLVVCLCGLFIKLRRNAHACGLQRTCAISRSRGNIARREWRPSTRYRIVGAGVGGPSVVNRRREVGAVEDCVRAKN